MIRIACLFLLAFSFLQQISAQVQDSIPSRRMMEITMVDKIIFAGEVLEEGRDTVVLRSAKGEMLRIPRNRISAIRYYPPEYFVRGRLRFPYPLSSVYLVAPSAIPLRSGEAVYQNHYILFNSVHVGITNFLSVSAFGEFISVLARQQPEIIGASVRGAFKTGKKSHAGLGITYVNKQSSLGFNSYNQRVIMLQGTFTLGNEESNVSVTAGIPRIARDMYVYNPSNKIKTESRVLNRPFLSFSAMKRVGKRLALMTDNWFLPTWIQYRYAGGGSTIYERYSYDYLLTYGLRFFGKKAALDFGFLNNETIASDLVIGYPYIAFNLKIG